MSAAGPSADAGGPAFDYIAIGKVVPEKVAAIV